MNKEYFQTYYQNHKEGYKKRHKEWNKNNPEGRKKIKKTYYENHREDLLKYSREYQRRKNKGVLIPRIRVLGLRIKEKSIKPFKERISPELREQMKYNSIKNNESKRFKFFPLTETKEDYLARKIVRGLIKMKEGG